MKSLIKSIFIFLHNIISGSKWISRNTFLAKIKKSGNVLEIGPFTNPSLRGENIYYFDVLNKNDLMKRAKIENYLITDIPEINFVSSDGDLSIVKKKFDNIYSSHCVEHQPDLIRHLVDVNNILKAEGKYYLVIPDKRYCFDALLPETNIASVLEAYYEKRKRHSLVNVLQHGALTSHNVPYKHWLGHHNTDTDIPEKIISVLKLYNEANGAYIDVHAWRFTPSSFKKIIDLLHKLNYINLTICEIFTTTFASNEFYVVLQKDDTHML